MRRHGWGGDLPVDDEDAVRRILEAARALLRENPEAAPTISEVAEQLSVTRQTVYRYFPSTHALLVASVSETVGAFLDDVSEHLRDAATPADAVVEGVAYTYEALQRQPDLALLLASGRSSLQEVTSDTAQMLGRSILERTPVDWQAAGFDDVEMTGLMELVLRTLQSFVLDPGTTARSPEALRAYLRRWVGPAVTVPAVR